jgi:hypothetical protein
LAQNHLGAPPRNQHEGVAIARRMHDEYEKSQDPQKLQQLIDFFTQYLRKVNGRLVRDIHHNPKNWVLIKFLPEHLRYISYRDEKGKWARQLFCKLSHEPNFPSLAEYQSYCNAVVERAHVNVSNVSSIEGAHINISNGAKFEDLRDEFREIYYWKDGTQCTM